MDERRFTLGWDRPSLPDASTHVTLFDGGTDPLHVVASGHGRADAGALADLLRVMKDQKESTEAIAFVSDAYAAATGRVPAHSR